MHILFKHDHLVPKTKLKTINFIYLIILVELFEFLHIHLHVMPSAEMSCILQHADTMRIDS